MFCRSFFSFVVSLGILTGVAHGEVLISEIMYNPDSSEAAPNDVEWVELYNSGSEEADVGGWYLADEDGKTAAIPDGTTLAAGKTLILVPGNQTKKGFRAAWGKGGAVQPLDAWGVQGLGGLSNSPGPSDEKLTVRQGKKDVVDEVDFDDEKGWPSDNTDGPSIYVKPGKLGADTNDAAEAWAASADGKHKASTCKQTDIFGGKDVGSPGAVATEK